MSESRMIFVSEKESFISRVLIKKVQGKGVRCDFVPFTINDINSNIDDAMLITLYVGEGEAPKEGILHFLSEKMNEKELHIILVGEKQDMKSIWDNVRSDLIYKTFTRPVDNELYAQTVKDYLTKAEEGAFKKSIMIVDDDPQYLTLVREWLKEDYNVAMANSGLQAIKMLGNRKVDLILLDHEMPVTSGPQVLEMLRSDPETASIPVMFLTGKRDKESVMAVVALKPEGYFLKDIQKEELLEKLKEFFILH